MKDGKYSVMIVEDQQMPKALFSHFIETSNNFYLQVAIENASVADVLCTRLPIDLILMDVITENGESGLRKNSLKLKLLLLHQCLNVHISNVLKKLV